MTEGTSERFNMSHFMTPGKTSKKSGFDNHRVTFYTNKRQQLNSRYSVMGDKEGLAMTPGSTLTRGKSAGVGGMSKTFENYIKSKERQDEIARNHVERLNSLAVNKLRHQQIA